MGSGTAVVIGGSPTAAEGPRLVTENTCPAEMFAKARTLCDPVLRRAVEQMPDSLRIKLGYHFGWRDATGHPTRGRSGKGLRAALVFAVAAACGAAESTAASAAAAIEMLHNFTLVHDDVMDGDEMRHGRATVWRLWGRDAAIVLGDAMHAMAIRLLLDLPTASVAEAVGRLEAATVELCRGQYEDLMFESGSSVGVGEYVRMVLGKTGALMGVACALGALCADADAATVAAFDRFGRELGVAFQFADDVLGIVGDPAVTGKPVGNDLIRRKRSLPVVAALESGCSAAAELSELYRSDAPMTIADVSRATQLVQACGALDWTRRQAELRAQCALAALPAGAATMELRILTRAAARRDQ
ncbi:polyprenyl synthetase family protein [Nocardia sputorum]|uniref:polyprenyl synthetase family protein n=1 Tax=Nocardia sputorum TaxID=2984338 RepID=UPI002490618B|nr:polyprenyl synthetase family protein [Nocardia sputorum]